MISLLIPIIAFSLINVLLNYVLYGNSTNVFFVYKLDESRPLFTRLWFIEVLFVGRLLLGDAGFSFIRNKYKVFSLLFLFLSILIDILNIELTWYVSRIIQCFPFMGLGIFVKEIKMFESHNLKKIYSCGSNNGGVFIILVAINQKCDIMYNQYNHSYIVFL